MTGRLLSFIVLLVLAVPAPMVHAEQTDGGIELSGELRGKTFDELEKEARDLAARGDWSAAIDRYQALIDELGDRLVPIDAGRRTFVAVRRLCHLRLAALPAEGLRLYRNRVDPQAQKWLDQGLAQRDPAPLFRIVQEAFASRPGDQALELLGDLAFERGRFDDAERWWRMLLPGKGGLDLHFPDTRTDPARVHARLLLSRLFRGDRDGWDEELKTFRALHPSAEGPFAGRKGTLADILEALARQSGDLALAPTEDWLTFAGDPPRNFLAPPDPRDPNRLVRLCQLPPWRFDLEKRTRIEEDRTTPAPFVPPPLTRTAARTLAFHPVIAGPYALTADARYVTAHDLTTGETAVWFDLRDHSPTPELELKLSARPELRYTLTVAGDSVLARLGAQGMRELSKDERARGLGDSFIVCLRRTPGPRGDRLRWLLAADSERRAAAVFEGTPLAHDGRAYIAVTRLAGDQAVTAIHCYPIEVESTPAPRWRQEVFNRFRPRQPRYQHQLLTIAGPNVVYCSHAGAVVALDAATGRHAWAMRYPSRGELLPGGEPSPRDLAPCVYAAGRLFVAPADCDRLLCLDPATGQLLWQREKIEVVHLLGVGAGRLIFTTPEGIRGVRAADGSDVPGWQHPGDGSKLASYGRGLLAGELVYWPTTEGLFLLNQRDGSSPDNLALLSPETTRRLAGNLALGDSCLIVADTRELRIFAPPARHRREQEPRTQARPASALERYRLALTEADAGMHEQARASFQQAEQLAEQALFGDKLRRLALQGRHEVLLEAAQAAIREDRREQAAELFQQARAAEFPVGARLRAAALAGDWQSIQQDRALRRSQFRDEQGRLEIGAALAAERLSQKLPEATPDSGLRCAVEDRPNLALPLFRAWEIALTPSERLLVPGKQRLLSSQKELLFLAAERRLTCREAAAGTVRWTVELPFAPAWVRHVVAEGEPSPACLGLLVASPGGIACLRYRDGHALWELVVPPAAEGFPPLAQFHLAGRRLSYLQGRWLFTLDAATGRVLGRWPVPADGPPRASGGPVTCTIDGNWSVVQAGGGGQWLLRTSTGAVLAHEPARSDPMFRPRMPLFLDQQGICLVTDSRRVVRFNPPSLPGSWAFTVPGATTRTGETPWLLGAGTIVLLQIPCNVGCILQRLDADQGRPLWGDGRLVSSDPIDPATIAWDDRAFYFVAGNVLYAHSLSDGQRQWERALSGPSGRWQVVRAGRAIAAYPVDAPSQRFQFRWLTGSVELDIALPLEDRGRGFPVVFCDRQTGQLLQRLNLTPAPSRLSFRCGWRADFTWRPRLERQPTATAPVVFFTDQGGVIALQGRAWGLQAADRRP